MGELQLEVIWRSENYKNRLEHDLMEPVIRRMCQTLCETMGYVPKRRICLELYDKQDEIANRAEELTGDGVSVTQNMVFVMPVRSMPQIQDVLYEIRRSSSIVENNPSRYLESIRNRPETDAQSIDRLHILVQLNEGLFKGIKQWVREEKKSWTELDPSDKELEERAYLLFPVMGSLEAVMHSLVRACHFEQLVDYAGTNRAAVIEDSSYDCQMWDGFLAKYWALHVLYPNIPHYEKDADMFLSNWQYQLYMGEDSIAELKKMSKEFNATCKNMPDEAENPPASIRYILEEPYASMPGTQILALSLASFEYLLNIAPKGSIGMARRQKFEQLLLKREEKNFLSCLFRSADGSLDFAEPVHKTRIVKNALTAAKYVDRLAFKAFGVI
ncbi:MAG: hypothetical protein IJ242_01170 [Clostridia bacterium]|nr:hypothetical protein [Clostridia bacterium]